MIGFLINPIAGMGGSVGLKGTDGDALKKSFQLGARPVSADRARNALTGLRRGIVKFYTCSGAMGEDVLGELGFDYEVVYEAKKKTTALDTKKACQAFLSKGSELILFSGGDGTARDVANVVGIKALILGIPAGVKMSSSVFAVSPESAGELLMSYALESTEATDGEILDIDEEAYRRGVFDVKLYGYARTLKAPLIQVRKNVFHGLGEEDSQEGIARFVLEFMEQETLYILGPGTTTKKICDTLGLRKTLLGVDVLKNLRIVAEDANEEKLLTLLETRPNASILVSPIGSQGFIFGRGNQQISHEVIRKVGTENVFVLSTPNKLSQTPVLYVDTGDRSLDDELRGRIRVITGYRMTTIREVRG